MRCEHQNGCGFFEYIKAIKSGVTECPKPNPQDCVRFQEKEGADVTIPQMVSGTNNMHGHGELLTQEETGIVANHWGY